MLTELHIRNFAIIEELGVTFGAGLNVISGETGAGKSIIVGAVNLLLGERASADMIRAEADAAVVEAAFAIGEEPAVAARLQDAGCGGGEELVVRRIVSASGRNRVYLNGAIAAMPLLAGIAPSLVNICGQHEHQVLLRVESHLDLLDGFGRLLPLREEYRRQYGRAQGLRERLRELAELQARRLEREEELRFHLRELEAAAIKPGEDESLQEEKRVLANMTRLMEHSDAAYETLYGRKGSLLEELRRAADHVREVRRIDAGLTLAPEDMEALYYQLEEMALTLRDYRRRLSFEPERLAAVEERLELLHSLKRKYGGSLESLRARREELAGELQGLQSLEAERGAREREAAEADEEAHRLAAALSGRRHEAAGRLEAAVEAEIRRLNMKEARFAVRFAAPALAGGGEPALHERGQDEVSFHISPNPGEPLRPLHRIASGGELSRVILAMKKVLARVGAVGTIVFDEVDSGIGGATAEMVGEMLRDVSRHHQVICITHLPQIACFADRHYRVVKMSAAGRTTTRMDELADEERADEIARMLGGVTLTDTTREHAREMVHAAGRCRGEGGQEC
jgi:DNA repair protein RecN (Recombination protein N)